MTARHMAKEGTLEPDREGWYWARCRGCRFKAGPFPDTEDAVDALMDHAHEVGWDMGVKAAAARAATSLKIGGSA